MCIKLNWEKRISSREFDENKDFLENKSGIYIWIFNGKPNRITYVGETKDFLDRFKEHFSNILTGNWNTYNMSNKEDFVRFLYDHWHKKSINEIIRKRKCYIPNNSELTFKDRFFNENHKNYLDKLDFAFATFKETQHEHIRKQIETTLIKGLRKRYAGVLKDHGIDNLEEIKNMESHHMRNVIQIGAANNNPTQQYSFCHTGEKVNEIPDDIKCITGYDYNKKEVVFDRILK